jgi:hypothetical protein
VLHTEEGTALDGSDFDSTNLPINLGKTAKPATLLLKRQAAEVAAELLLGLKSFQVRSLTMSSIFNRPTFIGSPLDKPT